MPSTSARSCCNEKAVCLDIVQHNKCNNRLRYASTWSLRNATYSKFCPVSCRGTCPACTASERSTSGLAKLYKVVDVVMFNDELSVLRYRLRLHSAFADTFVVAETAITYAGHAKPLHASNSLTEAEKRAYDVRIFVVPVLRSIASPTRSENWRRENHQRSSLNRYLADNFKKHLIFFSDLDEFLDPEAMRTTLLSSAHLADSAVGCITPRMRFYYYSEHCPVFEPWAAATLSRSDSYFFTKVVQAGMLLRWWGQGHSGGVGQNALAKHKFERHGGRAVCPEPDGLHGWHFSCARGERLRPCSPTTRFSDCLSTA